MVVGKGDTKRARRIFKSAQNPLFLRVGDEEKCVVPMKGDDGRSGNWERTAFLWSHTLSEKGESDRDGNALAKT